MYVKAELNTIICALIVGILSVIVWKITKYVSNILTLRKKLSAVPGLPRHWLLGNSRKGQVEDSLTYQEIVVKAAQSGHKIFCVWLGPIPIVSVNHADTFKELIAQTTEKCKGPTDLYRFFDAWLGDGLVISGGEKWERNRKLLTPAFHFNILNGYIEIMNERSNVLLDILAADTSDGTYVDVYSYLSQMSLEVALKCLLSYDGNIQTDSSSMEKDYIKAVRRIAELCWRRSVEPLLQIDTIFKLHPAGREFYRLCDQVHEFTGGIIKARLSDLEHKINGSEECQGRLDLLDILITARDEEGHGLSPQEIQDEVDTFVFGGHDTTSSTINWAIYALGKYPDLQQKVYEDVCDVLGDSDTVTKEHLGKFTYLQYFIKEVLRYFSPAPMIGRTNPTSPVILDGKEIPANVSMYVSIYAIHHNEDTWPNNMVFDPERFEVDEGKQTDINGFIPFSAGPRNCIGQVFGMNEIKINIAKLVKRFEVELDQSKEVNLLPNITMRAENGIYVRLKTRVNT